MLTLDNDVEFAASASWTRSWRWRLELLWFPVIYLTWAVIYKIQLCQGGLQINTFKPIWCRNRVTFGFFTPILIGESGKMSQNMFSMTWNSKVFYTIYVLLDWFVSKYVEFGPCLKKQVIFGDLVVHLFRVQITLNYTNYAFWSSKCSDLGGVS